MFQVHKFYNWRNIRNMKSIKFLEVSLDDMLQVGDYVHVYIHTRQPRYHKQINPIVQYLSASIRLNCSCWAIGRSDRSDRVGQFGGAWQRSGVIMNKNRRPGKAVK